MTVQNLIDQCNNYVRGVWASTPLTPLQHRTIILTFFAGAFAHSEGEDDGINEFIEAIAVDPNWMPDERFKLEKR